MISPEKLREIARLVNQGKFSLNRIAEIVNCSHNTVGLLSEKIIELGLTDSVLAELNDLELRNQIYQRQERDESKRLPNWQTVHDEWISRSDVSLQLLWVEYSEVDPESAYSYSQFTHLFRLWLAGCKLSMRQLHKAGQKMFVDFAGKPRLRPEVLINGVRHRVELFVAVLGASALIYAEATLSQQLPDWISANVNAFEYFGGSTEVIVPDCLKSAVIGFEDSDPIINPTFLACSKHYNAVVIPARPKRPKDKAHAEGSVLIVQRWICARLRHHGPFQSVAELNKEIWKLLEEINNKKFKKREGSRRSVFEAIERKFLQPLPENRFEYFDFRAPVKIGPDYHIEVFGNYYSVPYRLIGQRVAARVTKSSVELIHLNRRIAVHLRGLNSGDFITDPTHRPSDHRRYAEATPQSFVDWAMTVGPSTKKFIEALLYSKRPPELGVKSCLSVQNVLRTYGGERTEAACAKAIAINSLTVRTLRSLLKHNRERVPATQSNDAALPSHGNVRGANYYSEDHNAHQSN